MKGLIPSAGLATRLRPLTSLRPKQVVSVANKPIILHAVDNMVEAGITEIGIVVGPLTKPHIQSLLDDYPHAHFEFILQEPPLGIAHAVKVARPFLGDDPFVMYLGDNLFEKGIKPFVEAFKAGNKQAVLALVEVADPRALGVAVVDGDRIVKLVEKPEIPPSNLAVAGIYVFDSLIHETIETLPRGAKNEYQITDAIQKLIDQGSMVAPVRVEGWWKDTGKPEDVLDANRLVLMKLIGKQEGRVEDSQIIGEVYIDKDAKVSHSTIMGPAMIGKGAHIEHAYIGPFTSIGDEVVVKNAEIEYAVIEQRSKVTNIKTRLQASLIGVDVEVSSRHLRPKTHQLTLGDKSTIYLNE
ncbi:MAG: glucose-1-phosphate thymidylyltransferase [Deinococcales bacterium]